MATIEDISKLLTTFKAELKAELKAEMKADMAELKAEMKADMAELKAEIKSDMTEVIRREVRNIHEAQAQDFKQAEESLLPCATLASTSGMGKYYLRICIFI